jgi:ethanolamine utilization microcompartment shell protein EutS
VPAWSLRSAAVLCLAALAARPAASLLETLGLAAAALAVAALAVRPAGRSRLA